MYWLRRCTGLALSDRSTIPNMAVGLLCVYTGGAGARTDACALSDGHYWLGQIKPPAGFFSDDLVGD